MKTLHFYSSNLMKGAQSIAATFFVILCILHQCTPYPSGAPLVACQEMRPYHPPTTTSGAPPFAINLTSAVYKPGSEIKGTIYSPSGVVFRGFLIQARNASNSDMTPFGEFIVAGTDTHTNCGNGNKQALTHTTNSNKTKIDFTWKAPTSSQGDLHFKMTIVESYNVSRYWLSIYSSVVKDCSLHPSSDCDEITTEKPITSPSETTETSSVHTSPPEVITTMAPGKKIPNDPACGVTKGCFPDCSSGCDYLVTWQQAPTNGIEGVDFDLKMITEDMDNVWVAIGISPTGKMDGTNVIACLSGNDVTVESSHNEGYSNVMYSSKTMGLSNMQGSARDGVITCSFTRAKSLNLTDFMNLKDEAYLLVGSGPVINGVKQMHQKIPVGSANKVNFLSHSPGETTGTSPAETTGTIVHTSPPEVITTTVPGKKIPNDPACGVTKGCFPDCSSGCDYLVTWQQAPTNGIEGVDFDLKMMMEDMDNVWIAIGISPTGKMDDTNVIACLSGNDVTLESSHNEGYSNVMYSSKTMGLSNMQGSARDGVITCSFTRAMSLNITDFMNLKDEAYLLVGTGPVTNGIKQQHTKNPVGSASKVNFLSHGVSKESDSARPLIKLHGSLMVLAWVLCSSIGVVVARHCKSMMQGNMLCSVKYWFAIHRTLMFVVVLFVVVAFVAIFYEVGGFSKISAEAGKEYTKAHPYLGIIVTVLTLLNPIMAFFRPPPDHKSRPMFNWAHFSVGTAAHLISVVTIFFGIKLSKAKVDKYAIDVMICYTVIYVLVQFILEVHRRRNKNNYGKLNPSSGIHGPLTEESSKFANFVLFLHVIVMIVSATLLVLMICIPTHFHATK